MTHTASIAVTEADALRLASVLEDDPVFGGLAVDAVEEMPGRWRMTLYLAGAPDAEFAARLAATARAALGPEAPAFAFAPLPDADWVAKSLEGLKPVRAGRFLVHGGHDRDKRRPNDIGIEIEAGEAFGTGHHGTTAGCLLAIERTIRSRPIRNALDIGTGSGVLAIAIAKLAHVPVLASDIDPVAARVASANVRLNGAGSEVRVMTAAGIARRVFADCGPYDLIVANILAGPLVALAPSIRRRLAPGGTVILSGLTASQCARVVSAYRTAGLRLERTETRDDWAILTLTLRPA
ncbi:MAG TPA: 50S ribosomal protein L11 methyltransferase [Bauldia sp.]|nr:50S ribosomal protein L11 methyltransferase [Bauldia sp.]